MIPLRLVIDTNVVVSAALKREGLQRTVLLLALTKPAHWYVSGAILLEYASVLRRPQLKISSGERLKLLQLIKNRTRTIIPSRLPQVTFDPADNIFIECADPARADYLVTGHSASLSKVLEKHQNHWLERISDSDCFSPCLIKENLISKSASVKNDFYSQG